MAIRALLCAALVVSAPFAAAFAQVPFVYLDHVTVAVDSATLSAVRASGFVRDTLAGMRQESATTEDGAWAGIVVNGENNYLGLAAAGGGSELVLRCEQLGCSNDVAGILESMAHGSAKSELRHRMGASGSAPWYYKTWAAEMQNGPFSCWVYEPYADSTVPDRELGRKAMNARYYKPKRLLNNIIGVDVALPSDAIRSLTNRLSAFRFGAMFTGPVTNLRGPDVQLRLVPTSGTPGVTRIVFSLNRSWKGKKVYQFGPKSALTFDNKAKTATWTF